MFDAILKAKNTSFQKGMTFCRNIYVKKAMRLLAFIFEQPSYLVVINLCWKVRVQPLPFILIHCHLLTRLNKIKDL